MYDHEVTLVAETCATNDAADVIPSETKKTILCREKSVSRNEFYQAAAAGHKPSVVLVVHRYEYDGQRRIEYEGSRYTVLRTYAVDIEEIELVCEGVVNEAGD